MARVRRAFRYVRPAVVAAMTLALCNQPVAMGTNFGSQGTPGLGGTTNGVWLTQNDPWTVRGRGLSDAYRNGLNQTMNASYIPTDLSVAYTSIAPSCAPEDNHDLCVYDFDYGDNGLNGWNACGWDTIGSHPDQICTWDWVRVNLFFSPPPKRIMCHEVAHSVGLRHTQEQASCVKKTADGGDSAVLSAHDIGHINAEY